MTVRSLAPVMLALGMCMLIAERSDAATLDLSALIDGSQEVPPVSTSGSGSAALTFDTDTQVLGWNIEWQNLSGPATAMHFHGPAAAGSNTGVQLDIGATSGLTSPSIGSALLNSSQVSDVLANLWYINIHTSANPGGEIRGQVVPEPSSTALAVLGALAIACLARRPRR